MLKRIQQVTLSNRMSWIVGALALALALYPALLSWFTKGSGAYFQFFAADAFYYLTIAKNASWNPLFSYDGIFPTNGFNPLWQLLLKVSFSFPQFANNQDAQIAFAFWLSAISVALAAALVSFRLTRLVQVPFLALLAVVPGFLYFFLALVDPNYGSLWSYINGMESPLSLLFFACLLFYLGNNSLYSQPGFKPVILSAILVTLIVFARLDDVFLVIALSLPLVWGENPPTIKLKQIAIFLLIPAVAISLYCVGNYIYAGTYLPISGTAKSGISGLGNLARLFTAIIPAQIIAEKSWAWWSAGTWRELQMVLPAIVAGVFLAVAITKIRREKQLATHQTSLLIALAVYVILKACYNFAFVSLGHQGHWYYPLSILVANIIVAVGISQLLNNKTCDLRLSFSDHYLLWQVTTASLIITAILLMLVSIDAASKPSESAVFRSYSHLRLAVIAGSLISALGALFLSLVVFRHRRKTLTIQSSLIITLMLVLVTANAMLANKETTGYNESYEKFWAYRAEAADKIRSLGAGVRLVSYDDGIIAYSLGIPAMAGLGFALDCQASNAKAAGRLFDLAYERGFRWFTSLVYMPAFDAQAGDDVTEKLPEVFWLPQSERQRWRFRLAYGDPKTNWKVIEILPIAGKN